MPAVDKYESQEEDETLKEAGKIKLTILYNREDDDQTVVHAKPGTTFKKILAGYMKAKSISGEHVLMHDGRGIILDETPKMREWQVGRHYIVDCFEKQLGGL